LVPAHSVGGDTTQSTFVFSGVVSPDNVRDAQPSEAQPSEAQPTEAQPTVNPPGKGAATLKIVDTPASAAPATATTSAEDSPLSDSPNVHVPSAPQGANRLQASEIPAIARTASAEKTAIEISAEIPLQADASDSNSPQSRPFTVVVNKPPVEVISPVRIEHVRHDRVKIVRAPRRLPAGPQPRLAEGAHDRRTASLLPQPTVPASTSLNPYAQRQPQNGKHVQTPGIPTQAKNSADLQAMIHAARQHTDYGFGLASRGAVCSANEQFEQALKLIAQGLDAHDRTSAHSQALGSALTALEEANDLAPAAKSMSPAANVPDLIADHTTRVLDKAELASITPLTALRRYYAYAGQQFSAAGGNVKIAARAMYGMGRVNAYLAKHGSLNDSYSASKAAILYRAALEVDPENHAAANELGVMLARFGQWNEAQQVLERSVRLAPQATTARNLATVLQRRGDSHRAAHVRQLHAKLAARQTATETLRSGDGTQNPVRWVSHNEFTSQFRGPADGQLIAATLEARRDRQPPAAKQTNPPKRSFFSPFAKKLFPRNSK
jgi:tetratricopeptide (TPR) repeat protein